MSTQKSALSVQEVSEISGICRTDIYKFLKNGTLKARKLGRRTLILKQDLESFLADLPAYDARAQ